MFIFASIATTLWALLHVYVGKRMLQPMDLPKWTRRLAYTWLVASFLVTPALFMRGLWPAGETGAWLRGFGWLNMGNFTVLAAFIVARDLVLFVRNQLGRSVSSAGAQPESEATADRRRFLMRATGASAFGITGILSGFGIKQARTTAEVVEVEVKVPGLPEALDGYHIVQISDVHVGETIDQNFILPVVEKVGELGPDMVAVTGDIVDGSVERLKNDVWPLHYLRAPDGVFFVTGNHEFYSGAEEWCEHFASLGMTVLNNAHQLIEREGAKLLVGGVTDYRTGERAGIPSDPKAALDGAPDSDFKLLLAHQPRSAYAAAAAGWDLQMSGHTHGGQFFPWNLFVGLVQPVARGLAEIDGMAIYVNRGTCYWGPPLRTGVPAEITSLRLKRA